MIELDNVCLKIRQSRWNVTLELVLDDGELVTYVASADSGLTYGDGIFFGTDEEYREELDRL